VEFELLLYCNYYKQGNPGFRIPRFRKRSWRITCSQSHFVDMFGIMFKMLRIERRIFGERRGLYIILKANVFV